MLCINIGQPADAHSYRSQVPQQNNHCDCGVFVLQYVESFATDLFLDFGLPKVGVRVISYGYYAVASYATASLVSVVSRMHVLFVTKDWAYAHRGSIIATTCRMLVVGGCGAL